MNVRFVHHASLEFLDAISYYEKEQSGLGRRFKAEVDRTVLWLSEHSEACRLRKGGYRKLYLRVFPYYIPYIVRGSTLWILAVAHERREPEYWIERQEAV